jgi:hypothetical protein
MASRIGVFRRKVALGHYELTGHAKDEMEQDQFTIQDIKAGIYSGRVVVTQQHGRGNRKFVVHGVSSDGRGIAMICRLTQSGILRVITVFEI